MASTSAHKRRSTLPAALFTLLALALSLFAGSAFAADDAGGTSAGSAPSTKSSASTKKSTKASKPSPHVLSVRITNVRCTPAADCTTNPHQVSLRGTLLIGGIGLKVGMVVAFPKYPGARISSYSASYSPAARLRKTSLGLAVTVPSNAHSGHIMVLLSHDRYTSSYGPIYIYAHALHPPASKADPPPAIAAPASASAFEGQGMWIWYVSESDAANTAAIIAQAHAADVTTLYIKSSDGPTNFWSQFSPQLVAELHAAGLKVCAWQYVYGTEPVGEAALGAEAVADGADCLVIDAETEYEGHYAAAQTYLNELRAKIGPTYPLGLASFPYVFYHLKFPYSVFLGPGGAQFNVPQMYWKDIGNSVDTVYANTYIENRIYGRPIFPLGQTFGGVSAEELLRFRDEAVDYGASGISFWDWQETTAQGWETLAAPLAPLTSVTPNETYPEIASGSTGDPVLWMQEHLASAVPGQETTGVFSAQTVADVETFQAAHGIAVSGVVEAATWQALLTLAPVPVNWTGATPTN